MLIEKFQQRYQKKNDALPFRWKPLVITGAATLAISLLMYLCLVAAAPRVLEFTNAMAPTISRQGQWLQHLIFPPHPALLIVRSSEHDATSEQLYISVRPSAALLSRMCDTLNHLKIPHHIDIHEQQINIGPVTDYRQINRIETVLQKLNYTGKTILMHP